MLEVIEKLLILQDRDRKILRVKNELAHVAPERETLNSRLAHTQGDLDACKLRAKQIESERKRLELEAETKKQQIEKYSLQQFQTKKNEEYRALAHEIEMCKAAITKLDDQQIEWMEQAEQVQNEIAAATQKAAQTKSHVEGQLKELAQREESLRRELADFEANYEQLTSGVDESALARYERLRKQKGASSVVGVEHSVCGGCHMKLPIQVVLSCQAQQEIVSCPNCGRILYYARHMDIVAAE
jgi:uncharacterized protein